FRDLLGAADQVSLLEAARLLAQRGLLERLQMLPQLGGVEATQRFFARAADRDRELRGDVDGGAVATRVRGCAMHVLDAGPGLLGRWDRRHPALAILACAASDLRVVAARVDRQRILERLREALHVLEVHVAASERRAPLGEEDPERAHPLVDQ